MIIPDVSFYQYVRNNGAITEEIDFGVMATKTSAVIIRAGQGDWKDIAFDLSWANAKRAGLQRGSYWFYDSRVNPKKQADNYAKILGSDTGELPAYADFEDKYGGQWGRWQDWYDFLEYLKANMPNKQIGIYTGFYYWVERTQAVGISKSSLDYFEQYPLWIAAYGASPLIPKPWTTCQMWQFTDSGNGFSYGVKSREIDLNHYYGKLPDDSGQVSRWKITTDSGRVYESLA